MIFFHFPINGNDQNDLILETLMSQLCILNDWDVHTDTHSYIRHQNVIAIDNQVYTTTHCKTKLYRSGINCAKR